MRWLARRKCNWFSVSKWKTRQGYRNPNSQTKECFTRHQKNPDNDDYAVRIPRNWRGGKPLTWSDDTTHLPMNTEHSLWSYRVCWWAEEVWEGHDEWTMICSISVMVYVCRNLSWLSCVKILRLKQLLSIPLLIRLWVSRILSQFCNDPNTTLCCCKNETSRPPWISVGRLGTRSIQCDTCSLPPSLQIQTQLLVCYTRHTHQEFQII